SERATKGAGGSTTGTQSRQQSTSQSTSQSAHAEEPVQTTCQMEETLLPVLTELEYHLEEVYKATTDQLDWVNPEDLVPRDMWIQQPIDYNKHALWGVSDWGRKRKQFYGYAVNQESA
nr:hypothetical protein [Tanacetum cinerariifolium]